MDADVELPLFPLNVVLFPDSALPLHIFEDRYRTLVGECLEQEGKEFGINLVVEGQLKRVGCSAVVREVVCRYTDGRMDIVVEGKRRYELRELDETSAPYFIGHVTFFAPESREIDIGLADRTMKLYDTLIKIAYKEKLPKPSLKMLVGNISFIIAQKAGLTLPQRQDLLEMHSENERLRVLFSYLTEVVPKLHQLQEVQRIVGNDGYL